MKARFSNNKGVFLTILAFTAVSLIALSGLAFDVAHIAKKKGELQRACDAAAVAGLTRYINETTLNQFDQIKPIAETAATQILRFNVEQIEHNITGGLLPNNFSAPDGFSSLTRDVDGVVSMTVSARLRTKAVFMGLFSASEVELNARARTQVLPAVMSLVLDLSNSMSVSDFNQLKAAALNFVSKFNSNNDRISLITFSNQAIERLPMQSMNSTGYAAMQAAINALTPGDRDNGTNVAEALVMARREIESVLANPSDPSVIRMVVLFSDGAPNIFRARFTHPQATYGDFQYGGPAGFGDLGYAYPGHPAGAPWGPLQPHPFGTTNAEGERILSTDEYYQDAGGNPIGGTVYDYRMLNVWFPFCWGDTSAPDISINAEDASRRLPFGPHYYLSPIDGRWRDARICQSKFVTESDHVNPDIAGVVSNVACEDNAKYPATMLQGFFCLKTVRYLDSKGDIHGQWLPGNFDNTTPEGDPGHADRFPGPYLMHEAYNIAIFESDHIKDLGITIYTIGLGAPAAEPPPVAYCPNDPVPHPIGYACPTLCPDGTVIPGGQSASTFCNVTCPDGSVNPPGTVCCSGSGPAPGNNPANCPQFCQDGSPAPGNDPANCPLFCPDGSPAPGNNTANCPVVCADGSNPAGNDPNNCPKCLNGIQANSTRSNCPTCPQGGAEIDQNGNQADGTPCPTCADGTFIPASGTCPLVPCPNGSFLPNGSNINDCPKCSNGTFQGPDPANPCPGGGVPIG